MEVTIGVDPHKASHTAVAIDTDEDQLDLKKARASRARSSNCSPGRNRSGRACGRSKEPTARAICWPSSSSRQAST